MHILQLNEHKMNEYVKRKEKKKTKREREEISDSSVQSVYICVMAKNGNVSSLEYDGQCVNDIVNFFFHNSSFPFLYGTVQMTRITNQN